jgi:hypothetical protein
MQPCFCKSNGCQEKGGVHPVTQEALGTLVDARTFKSHQRQDRVHLIQETRMRASQAVDAEVDAISIYLEGISIDKTSESSTPSSMGGPSPGLSENITQDGQCLNTPIAPRACKPSRRSKTELSLQRLAVLHASMKDIVKDFSVKKAQLETTQDSSLAPQAYPLQSLLNRCDAISQGLDAIIGKEASVTELKRSIKEELDDVKKSLQKVKGQRKLRRQQSHSNSELGCLQHDSGDLLTLQMNLS